MVISRDLRRVEGEVAVVPREARRPCPAEEEGMKEETRWLGSRDGGNRTRERERETHESRPFPEEKRYQARKLAN